MTEFNMEAEINISHCLLLKVEKLQSSQNNFIKLEKEKIQL